MAMAMHHHHHGNAPLLSFTIPVDPSISPSVLSKAKDATQKGNQMLIDLTAFLVVLVIFMLFFAPDEGLCRMWSPDTAFLLDCLACLHSPRLCTWPFPGWSADRPVDSSALSFTLSLYNTPLLDR